MTSRVMLGLFLFVGACGDAAAPGDAATPRAQAHHEAVEPAAAEVPRDAGVAVDAGATVRADLSSGWNWIRATREKTDDLWGVWASGDRVIAVGMFGLILRSTDGGASWTKIPPGGVSEMNGDGLLETLGGVWGHDDRWVVIGFENDIVGFSGDGGLTWSRQVLRLGDEDFEPSAVWGAGRDVYMVGYAGFGDRKRGGIYVSHDQGETWSLAIDVKGALHAVGGTPDGREVYVVGDVDDRAAMYRSSNRGRSWTPVHDGGGWKRIPGIRAMDAALALSVLRPGEVFIHLRIREAHDGDAWPTRNHSLAHTTDGGKSWTIAPVTYRGPSEDIEAEDAWWEPDDLWAGPKRTLYASLQGRYVSLLEVSHDAGRSWRVELAREPSGLATSTGTTYVVGSDERGAYIGVRRP